MQQLLDVVNEVTLLAPAFLIVVLAGGGLYRRRIDRKERAERPEEFPLWKVLPEEWYLGVLTVVPVMLFIVFFRADIGMSRDWDLFAIAPLGMMPVTVLVLLRSAGSDGADRVRASVVPLVVCGIVLSVSWIGVNASTERSISRFKHSIGYDRTNVAYAYETLAKTYTSLSRAPEAMEAMEAACVDSWNPRRMVILGGMRHRAGDVAGALDTYKAVMERSPQYSLARERMIAVLVEGQTWEEIAVVARGGTELFPDSPFYFYYLGQALNALGHEAEGQEALKRSQLLQLRSPRH